MQDSLDEYNLTYSSAARVRCCHSNLMMNEYRSTNTETLQYYQSHALERFVQPQKPSISGFACTSACGVRFSFRFIVEKETFPGFAGVY